ncbi:MAG: dihydroneopterin aldolase [Chitinispirillaceae bacterium]|nr:dihydroneopterin aldolase [Chitinispirillaceae bacterium]
MDRIMINDLAARCIIGTNESERTLKQDVLITISLYTDLAKAGKSDRIEDSVDYRTLKKKVLALVENSSFFLVESLAAAIAEICLADPRVVETRVMVEKPGALRYARSAGVEIRREQRK